MNQTQVRSVVRRFYVFEFLSGIHFMSAVLIPFFTDWGGISIATAQALQSWFTLCIFALEVPTGVVADHIGRKYSLCLGSLVMALGALLYGLVPHIASFAVAEFLFATGVALVSGADKALLWDALLGSDLETDTTAIYAKSRTLHLLGILIAAPIGSIMAGRFGLNSPMLFTSLSVVSAALIALSIPEPKSTHAPKEIRNYGLLAREAFLELRHNAILTRWIVNSVLVASTAYFVIWLYQPFMLKLGFEIRFFGFAHAALVTSEILVFTLYGKIWKLLGSPKKFFKLSAIIVSLGFLLAVAHPSATTLVVFLIFSGGLGLTRSEFMATEMNRYIQSKNRATMNSYAAMFARISQAILNPFVGLATDRSVFLSLLIVGLIPLFTLVFPLNGEEEIVE